MPDDDATQPNPAEHRLVTGLFRDRQDAERAFRTAAERGYGPSDVTLVMSDETRRRFGADMPITELGNKAAEGAGIGGAIGGTLGAIAAALAGLGSSHALPRLGQVIAGPVAAALAGAGAGAATGGLVGALIGWGIPEERVKQVESDLREGGVLMGVQPRSEDDARWFQEHWARARGELINDD